VPQRGEVVEVGGLRLAVMLTRGGSVRWFRVSRLPEAAGRASGADAA
jgi:magnesium and cobalt transporter